VSNGPPAIGWPADVVAPAELDSLADADELVADSLVLVLVVVLGEPEVSTKLGVKAGSPPSRVALTMTPTTRMPTPTSPTLITSIARARISAPKPASSAATVPPEDARCRAGSASICSSSVP
jgi:hypothetical protein